MLRLLARCLKGAHRRGVKCRTALRLIYDHADQMMAINKIRCVDDSNVKAEGLMPVKLSAALLICTLSLNGCARPSSKVTSTYTVDGKKAFTIECGQNGATACQTVAGNICRADGYQVVNQTNGNAGNASLMVVCNQPSGEVTKDLLTTMERQCPSVVKALNAPAAKPDQGKFILSVVSIRRGILNTRDAAGRLCCENPAFESRFASPAKGGDAVDAQFQQLIAEANCEASFGRRK